MLMLGSRPFGGNFRKDGKAYRGHGYDATTDARHKSSHAKRGVKRDAGAINSEEGDWLPKQPLDQATPAMTLKEIKARVSSKDANVVQGTVQCSAVRCMLYACAPVFVDGCTW